MKTMRRKAILILGVMLRALAGLAGTLLNPTVLSNGVVVSGYIAPGGEEWFMFQREGILSLETCLGSLPDSVMYVYEAKADGTNDIRTGGPVTLSTYPVIDDDGGVGLASKLERPWVSSGGVSRWANYVKVTGYSASQAGTFSIVLRDRSREAVIVTGDGKRHPGNIKSATDCCWYKVFCLGPGPVVMETALGTCPDTYMELYDAYYGRFLASDDDSGEGLASRLNTYLTNHPTGVQRAYYVKVRAYAEYQTGTFEFWVRPVASPRILRLTPDKQVADDPKILVTMSMTNVPAEYILSENPSFSGSSWKYFGLRDCDAVAVTFVLSPSNGIKTIYAKVRNAAGESPVATATCELRDPAVELAVNGSWYTEKTTNYTDEYWFYASQSGRYEVVLTSKWYYAPGVIISTTLRGPHTRSFATATNVVWTEAYITGTSRSPVITMQRDLSPGAYYLSVDKSTAADRAEVGSYKIAVRRIQ